VKYLRSLRFVILDTIGKSKMSEKEILGEFALLYSGLESLTGNEELRAMFWKEFSQKNTVAVVCNELHSAGY